MRLRVLFLPFAAVLIVVACAYKQMRTYNPALKAAAVTVPYSAPPIELGDHHAPQRLIRLQGYLGRHRVLVVFFDGERGVDRDPILMRLVRDAEQVRTKDFIVLGVTAAVPQFNRAAIGRLVEAGILPDEADFPFPLLSDVSDSDPAKYLAAHRAWGRYNAATDTVAPGMFFVDRTGQVTANARTGKPQPLADPVAVLDELLEGN